MVWWSSTWVLASGSRELASGLFHRGAPWLQSLIYLGLSVSADPWGHNTSLTARDENGTPALY